MKVQIIPSQPLNHAGFHKGEPIEFDASVFDTVGSLLEKLNKYRGPTEQILQMYRDSAGNQPAGDSDLLIFVATLFVRESSFGRG